MPLLDGLAAVHAAKFLHRDIKPNNIFIRSGGSPVLLDFGAARATGGGSVVMTAVLTPGYAPLEQYSAECKQGPWSDIYALGGVLFRAARPAPALEAPAPAPDLRPPPPDPLPSRELAPEADPRERPSRPLLLPDRAPSERVQEESRGADRDRDGYLSRDEVQGRFPFIQREFGRVDADGGGRISQGEFEALRRRQAEGFPKPKP
jgi:serine/threonine protein kinase